MAENLNFLVSPLLLALFGLPAAFVSNVRRESPGVRLALAFLAGTVAYVIWCTVMSLFAVTWSVVSVALPLGVVSVAGAYVASRRSAEDREHPERTGWDALALAVGAGATLHLVLMAAMARATSSDFFFFWGPKAMAFAEARGLDAAYLASPWTVHAHAPYPPLVPVVTTWGIELAGRLPWRAALVASVMWVVLAYPVVLRGLRSRLPAGEATLASGVWMTGIALAVAGSYSAGNAEPPLIFYTTVAIVALIAREGTFPGWVAPLAACGMVLTKSEGLVLWVLIVAGAGLREILERTRLRELARRLSGIVVAPPLALGTWIAFQLRNDLVLSDPAREAIGEVSLGNLLPAVVESVRYLEAGSGWIAWVLAGVVIAFSWRGWRAVLPALAVAFGMLGFMLVYYLHYQGDSLGIWVSWTLPRVSLTALSAALLAAAVASGWRAADRESDRQG
jgi:hypothetical protein